MECVSAGVKLGHAKIGQNGDGECGAMRHVGWRVVEVDGTGGKFGEVLGNAGKQGKDNRSRASYMTWVGISGPCGKPWKMDTNGWEEIAAV